MHSLEQMLEQNVCAFDHAETQQHVTICNRMSNKCCMLYSESRARLTRALELFDYIMKQAYRITFSEYVYYRNDYLGKCD